jgi:hypothetical protein
VIIVSQTSIRRGFLALGLLEGVVDGDGVAWIGPLTHSAKYRAEAALEEFLSLLFAATKSVGRGDELCRLTDLCGDF